MVLAALWLAGCHKKSEPSVGKLSPPVRVRVQTVERKSHFATEDVVGTVRAKLHAAIEAKVSGRIERMLVVPGQSVNAGEPLIERREVDLQLAADRGLLSDAYEGLRASA